MTLVLFTRELTDGPNPGVRGSALIPTSVRGGPSVSSCGRCGHDPIDSDGYCWECAAVTLPDGRWVTA